MHDRLIDFMTIYLFGNPILKQDSLPIRLSPKLKKRFPHINFIIKDPTENWTDDAKEVTIIDTIAGINKVTVFHSLEAFQNNNPRISPHDYDVFLDLALLLKLGKIKKTTIIGMPPTLNSRKALKQLTPHITNLTLST